MVRNHLILDELVHHVVRNKVVMDQLISFCKPNEKVRSEEMMDTSFLKLNTLLADHTIHVSAFKKKYHATLN
jgi:hypothetical protein